VIEWNNKNWIVGNWLFFKGGAPGVSALNRPGEGEGDREREKKRKKGKEREVGRNPGPSGKIEKGLLRHDAGDASTRQPQPHQHLALQPATPHLARLLLLCSVRPGAWHHLWPSSGSCPLLVPTGSALYSAFTATNCPFRLAAAPWRGSCFQREADPKCLPCSSYPWYWLLHFWSGRKQPLHLPPTTGVWRRWADADVSSFRQRHQLKGVYRPRNQPKQMLRLRQLWQPNLCSGCDTSDEWIPNRDEETQGPAEETKGRQPAVLNFSPLFSEMYCVV